MSEFKIIPGFPSYAVNKTGDIVCLRTGKRLKKYRFNGYFIVHVFYESPMETLPVHRAVALAWVKNSDPAKRIVVNHLDGNPLNNVYLNLEWTTASGNNYHAIAAGLRRDNLECFIRDYETKEVKWFPSVAQAAEAMGLRKCTCCATLYPKKFGKLHAGRYEFRYAEDETPWFYENRARIKPVRYMCTVFDEKGQKEEYFSVRSLLRKFCLYKAKGRSMTDVVAYAKTVYPDHRFYLDDAVIVYQQVIRRNTKLSQKTPVFAYNGVERISFPSLSKCALAFSVDRSSIIGRLDTIKSLKGWTFTTQPVSSEMVTCESS